MTFPHSLFNRKPGPLSEFEEAVLAALELVGKGTAEPMPASWLVETVGRPSTTIGSALHRLMVKGRVQREVDDDGQVLWSPVRD